MLALQIRMVEETAQPMSEYLHVEKPFLDQLAALGWEVIGHGPHGIPGDAARACERFST